MEPQWQRARERGAREAWEGILRPVAGDLAADARGLSERALPHVRGHVPELFPDPETAEENRASTEASVRAFAAMVIDGADPHTTELPPATLAYAQAAVRRGVPLAVLMRSYRLSAETVWQHLLGRLAERATSTEQLAAASSLASAWLYAYADVAMTLAERFYEAERERWVRSTAASQAETIDAVLAGRQRDPGLASARLRYDLDRHHIAVNAWLETVPDAVNPLAALEGAVAEVAAAAGAERTLIQTRGVLAVDAWLSRSAPFADDVLGTVRLTDAGAPGVRVAVGEPGVGLAGFRRSHGEAGHARRVAALGRRGAGSVTRYGRVALSAMATVDHEQARTFVERELGPLAADDEVSLRLAATLRTYLDEHASRSRAAKRLGIHENTVTYRIRQAEEILWRSVEERTLELRVALALAGTVRHAPATGP